MYFIAILFLILCCYLDILIPMVTIIVKMILMFVITGWMI